MDTHIPQLMEAYFPENDSPSTAETKHTSEQVSESSPTLTSRPLTAPVPILSPPPAPVSVATTPQTTGKLPTKIHRVDRQQSNDDWGKKRVFKDQIEDEGDGVF